MTKSHLIILLPIMIIAVFAVSGCLGKTGTAAFVGGTDGLTMSFQDLPPTVFANVPFNLVVLVQNAGESFMQEGEAKFTLNNALQFGISPNTATVKNAYNLTAAKRINNTIIPGRTEPISWGQTVFTGQGGAPLTEQQPVPLAVYACYPYSTKMLAMACAARSAKGCQPVADKPVQSSGAPIQITKLSQVAQSIDNNTILLSFSIEIANEGKGDVYASSFSTICPNPSANIQNFVNITSIVFGNTTYPIDCRSGSSVSLSDGKGSTTCKITIPTKVDFEDELFVTFNYTYKQKLTTDITVIPT